MTTQIIEDDLSSPDTVALLRVHLTNAASHSPPESVHALDLSDLQAPEVTVWSVRDGSALLGFGALKQLDPSHGEIKSMHTAAAHRRKGVAALLVRHIINKARRRGYDRLSLETGSMDAFAAARALYASFGFGTCGPFAEYRADPHSIFMTLEISENTSSPDTTPNQP
ncbi:MAG: GNAT family N-acetyltransferase [Pseudomonadota bacterium]